MAKALGIGGMFFKAEDPKGLAKWYETWLGIAIDPSFGGATFHAADLPENAYAVWAPFNAATTYFEPSEATFMMNLIVDDISGALRQVQEGGAAVIGETQELDYGDFGWFMDPAGNKVELWEPK